MKMLSILNVSNRENPGSDSGVIFHKVLFEALKANLYEVIIASPFKFELENVQFYDFEPGKNKYDVRFRFEWEKYKALIEESKPDIIFCHQVEHCSSIRALIVALGLEKKIKLITYYHYLPAMEKIGNQIIWDPSLNHSDLAEVILFKVLSSLMSCDLFFVTSKYSKKFIIQLAKFYNINFVKEKIVVMPPPTDPYMDKGIKKKYDPSNKRILYSSRLYEQYGTDFLLSIIDHYKNSEVKFVITDFFKNKSASRKRLDNKTEEYRRVIRTFPNTIMVENGDNRKIYRDEIIANCSLVLGPYRRNANWSMGMLDAFALMIPGIAPNFASFPEFTPKELLYSTKREAIELIDNLLNKETFWRNASRECHSRILNFSPAKVSKIFLNSLERL